MDAIPYALTVIGLVLGTLLGLKGWLDPGWGAALVRLQPRPDQPEGVAEFRGTFGGMFFALHAVALVWVAAAAMGGAPAAGVAAASVVAAGWWGTAAARFHAWTADAPARHPFVVQSIGIEIVAGALIAAWPIRHLFG